MNGSLAGAKVPASLANAGEYGENIYDLAKASDWGRAATKLAALKEAARQIRTDLGNASTGDDKLASTITVLDGSIAAKYQQATMEDANQVTRIVAEMRFKPPVPIEVTHLDYEGRELEVWSRTKDAAKFKATADDMARIWETVRPQVESHGGAAEAKKFGELAVSAGAATTTDEYARLAELILDEVDNLEKVFENKV